MTDIVFAPTPDPNSPTGVYIPTDLADCFRELDKTLPAGMIEEIKACDEDSLIHYHFGLGMWIRNNWGLWIEQSRLKQYFDSIGVSAADGISGMIVTCYWQYLNGRPIELPRQIAYDKIVRDKIARDEIKNGPKTGNLS